MRTKNSAFNFSLFRYLLIVLIPFSFFISCDNNQVKEIDNGNIVQPLSSVPQTSNIGPDPKGGLVFSKEEINKVFTMKISDSNRNENNSEIDELENQIIGLAFEIPKKNPGNETGINDMEVLVSAVYYDDNMIKACSIDSLLPSKKVVSINTKEENCLRCEFEFEDYIPANNNKWGTGFRFAFFGKTQIELLTKHFNSNNKQIFLTGSLTKFTIEIDSLKGDYFTFRLAHFKGDFSGSYLSQNLEGEIGFPLTMTGVPCPPYWHPVNFASGISILNSSQKFWKAVETALDNKTECNLVESD